MSDVGNFKVLNPNISNFAGGFWNGIKGWVFGTNNPDIGIGQTFSTNPDMTWAGHLPQSYSSNNPVLVYAVGGAKVATDNPQSKFSGLVEPTIPSVKTQINTHLENNPKLDPKALYAVWIGSNDIMGIKGGGKDLKGANVEVIKTATENQVEQINRLVQAGAKTILVPSVPDIGITPEFNSTSERQKISDGASYYNATLYQGLQNSQTIKSKNANIIPANTYALLNEVVADYRAFGFKYGNGKNDRACKTAIGTEEKNWGCGKSEWQTKTANEEYIFADGIHPTGKTHRLLAQYYQSLIDAPVQMAKLPDYLEKNHIALNETLHRNLDNKKGKVALWVDGGGTIAKNDHTNIEQNGSNVLAGMDFGWTDKSGKSDSRLGLYVGKNGREGQLSNAILAEVNTTSVGLYRQDDWGNFRLQSDFGYHHSDINTKRTVAWEGKPRTHTGETTGKALNAGVQASYAFQTEKTTIRPFLGIDTSFQAIEAFAESNPEQSTALAYGFHSKNGEGERFIAVQGRVGYDMDYQVSEKLTVQSGLAYRHTFAETDTQELEVALPSVVGAYHYTDTYTTPIENIENKAVLAHLGMRFDFGKGAVNAGVTTNRTQDETTIGGYVGVQASF